MEGLILLFLVVVVMVFVVPAVALAKASRASRAIEELKQRLLMLEARLHRSSEDAPATPPEIVTQPKPAAPIIRRFQCRHLCPLPPFRRQCPRRNRSSRLKRYRWRPPRRPRGPSTGSNSWARKCSLGLVGLPFSSGSPSS